MKKIYLDYNATTPVLPEIFKTMQPFLTEKWGNPSSPHWGSDTLNEEIDKARCSIASTLNCKKENIYFTSCGTESDNWAIKSVLSASNKKRKHIITTAVEHPAIIETCKFLETIGTEVTYLEVDENGELDLALLEKSIKDTTVLISVMLANNETGVLFPAEKIGKIAEKHNVLFHIDAVQAYGKLEIDTNKLNVDLLSLSGHKVYAPKGIGVLFVNDNVNIKPFIHGGGQEKGLRSGTENVASIVALGKSAEIIKNDFRNGYISQLQSMRDYIEERLLNELSPVEINGYSSSRICNTTNISFKNIETTALIKALSHEGIAVSAGSACASHKDSFSHVLKAMGRSKLSALSAIRISIGKGLNEEIIEHSVNRIIYWVKKLRAFSPEKY